MLPVNRKDLVNVLTFLEEKSEKDYKKTLKEAMSREELFMKAERALELEKQINVLLEQVDKLQAEKDEQSDAILKEVDAIKGKSTKVGNILLMVHETIKKNPKRITYQYKQILDKILEMYEIEARFVTRLKNKYKTVTPGSKHVSKELEMQREAKIKKLTQFIEAKTGKKIVLKENFIAWLGDNLVGLAAYFDMWYKILAPKAQEIYELFENMHELAHHSGIFEGEVLKEELGWVKKMRELYGDDEKGLRDLQWGKNTPAARKQIKKYGGRDLAMNAAYQMGRLADKFREEEIAARPQSVKENVLLLKKLSGKIIKLEAMNRPGEQRSIGRKPVLDADQHVETFPDEKMIRRAEIMQKKYGNLEAASDFVATHVDTTPGILVKLLNISMEEAQNIIREIDNGDDDQPLQERTNDEVKAITGKHKMNEMRPDEIAVTTGKTRRIVDADQHKEKIYPIVYFTGHKDLLKRFLVSMLTKQGIETSYKTSGENMTVKVHNISEKYCKQIDKMLRIISDNTYKTASPQGYGGWVPKDKSGNPLDEVKDLKEEDYPWNKCISDQKKKYGKEGAKKVCGSIKAKS